MKLIHCADLHLDSRLQAHLGREQAKQRRDELLRNFSRLADYASENGVEAILICGDLFDRDIVSALTRNMVLSVITTHPAIRFYYLRGNHDTGDCLDCGSTGNAGTRVDENSAVREGVQNRGKHAGDAGAPERKGAAGRVPSPLPADGKKPGNLFLFGPKWRTYTEGHAGGIAITGIELTRENSASAQASLRLDSEKFNIVMLHGREAGKDTGNGYEAPVHLRGLRRRGIDYLALGHVHAYKREPLDSRGFFCYPGCLEGRGFDECGQHGFVLLEVDETAHAMTHRFVPFARRTLYALETDISGCRSTAQMGDLIRDTLHQAGCTRRDMVSLTLCGELDADCEKDTAYLRAELENRFFFARLQDRTSLHIDPEEYRYDESLRGEFVRLVMADPDIPESEKAAVIRCGFAAMDGEEL